jgi:hypothetical protein
VRRACRGHRRLTPRFPVGPEEAAFFVHELLVRTPAAGAAVLWLDERHELLDLFAVVCGDHEVEDVASAVLRTPSPVAATVVGSRLAPGVESPGDDLLVRWRALRARFDPDAVELVDWLVVGEEVIWSLDEVDFAS